MDTRFDFIAQKSEAILSNGSRLIVLERPGMPIYLRAAYFSGSRFDPIDKEGLAHFVEHMLVAGTDKFPTKDKLAAYIEKFGGEISASTGAEVLNVNVSLGDPNDLREAVMVLEEILRKPLFDDTAVENERGSILRELESKRSTPKEMVWEVYRKLFFQNTPIGRSNLGSVESINQIGKQDLLGFYREMMTGNRMVIIISGGIDLDTVQSLIKNDLIISSSKKFTLGPELPIIRSENVLVEPYTNISQVELIFGFRTENALSVDVPVLEVIAEMLGGGRASILSRKLRYEKGLVYTVSCGNGFMSDSGAFIVKTSTSKDKVQEVLDIIVSEISRICKSGLNEEEVAFTKEKIIKSKREQMQTSLSWVNFYFYNDLIGKNDWGLTKYFEEISSVTSEQTKMVAQKYFKENSWYLALCGDIKKEQIKVDF